MVREIKCLTLNKVSRVIPDIIAFFHNFTGVNDVIKPTPSDVMLSKTTYRGLAPRRSYLVMN